MENFKIDKYQEELDQINIKLNDPSKLPSQELSGLYSRQSELFEIVNLFNEINKLKENISQDEELIQTSNEQDIIELAKSEVEELTNKLEDLQKKFELLIIPPDPNDNKNVILEIRAGTGGEEASLFANDLLRMYSRFATLMHWQLQLLNMSASDTKGIKEAIVKITGKQVYKHLKTESGVHRVQRVPETESAGRIHTSAASVVVMPEIDDIDIKINPNDLRIDVYRSGGNGGQSVNTTDSAVRITHLPSGLVVTCQDTKDQQKNRVSAMSVLRSRLYQMELEKQNSEISDIRKSSIKTGDRSDKIKTYNFPQDRLTDHRIKKSWYGLDKFLSGEIEAMINETLLEMEKL